MKLISMVKRVIELEKEFNSGKIGFKEFTNLTCNYANLLNQPLELGMFVPCCVEGEILNYNEIKQSVIDGTETWDIWENAKERVIFEGFFISNSIDSRPTTDKTISNGVIHVFWYTDIKQWYLSNGLKKIEDLVKHNLTLTPNAIKKIGL